MTKKIGEYDDGEFKIEIFENGSECKILHKGKSLDKCHSLKIIMQTNEITKVIIESTGIFAKIGDD